MGFAEAARATQQHSQAASATLRGMVFSLHSQKQKVLAEHRRNGKSSPGSRTTLLVCVAVEELSVSHYTGETLLANIYIYILHNYIMPIMVTLVPLQQPSQCFRSFSDSATPG